MASFAPAFDQVIIHEGTALVRDNNGAWAKYGINQAANPGVDVQNLTKSQAMEIYRSKYWNPLKLGDPRITSDRLGATIFDMAVNAGTSTAAKLWQACLQDMGKDIVKDGRIGPATLDATASVDQEELGRRFSNARLAYYGQLSLRDPIKYGTYLDIWKKRVYAYYPAGTLDKVKSAGSSAAALALAVGAFFLISKA